MNSQHAPWVVVDVETSGTDPTQSRIISVAALAVDDAGTITDSVHTLVNPGVEPGPTHIHGITADMLHGSPQFPDIANQLATLLRGRIMVAHNAAFDYAFLANEFQRANRICPVDSVMCTVDLSTRLGLSVDNHKLATLAQYWRVTQIRPHDAADDAQVLSRILAHSLNRARALSVALPLRSPATLHPPTFTATAAA